MNSDITQGNWKELKGKILAKWGKFTENEVEEFKGNLEQIVGKIQKTYGYAKDTAELEFKEFQSTLSDTTNSISKH